MEFPLRGLNLGFLNGDGNKLAAEGTAGTCVYDLCGIVQHHGKSAQTRACSSSFELCSLCACVCGQVCARVHVLFVDTCTCVDMFASVHACV